MRQSPEASIQAFPLVTTDPVLQSLQDEGTFRPGSTLVQSPYDNNSYVEMSEAKDIFAIRKYVVFSSVCMALGAKRVKIEEIRCQTETGETTFGVTGNRLAVKAEGGGKKELFDKFTSHLTLEDVFEGGEPDVAAAESILRRNNLMNEATLRSMVEMAYVSSNRMKSRSFTLSLSRETQSRLELAASLAIPIVAGIDVRSDSKNHRNVEYRVSVNVEF